MNRVLCKGFSVERPDRIEILFAQLPDGRVVRHGPVPFSHHFDAPGRVCESVDYVPGTAEYIGTYLVPAVILGDTQ
ncbi:hypothetical protein [Rhizobacter sp. Root1221]|uniref:hypothetical protein n=1 Tax=Rhizobacter sp. Root1221 TaxID=1736433 RepID=UPI0006F76471|nr:hypothetical protein [Rhizobacter sp. Root1221]KQV99952.1 hypothetical protein ASC87_19825 [Rhizobacter sp. Root1221]